jgi:hypothetical protein
MKCAICLNELIACFQKNILNRYTVTYYSCEKCGFLQTEDPFWLSEAYTVAVHKMDIGLLSRCAYNSTRTRDIIYKYFQKDARFLDYGGGYGVFTRMMRDGGINFCHFDPHCDNLFAFGFGLDEAEVMINNYELITAFEVIEHLKDPLGFFDNCLKITDNILFSTELTPDNKKDAENWWYLAPQFGQHIAFYMKKTLQLIADKNKCHYYTDGVSLHLFCKTKKNSLNKFLKKRTFKLPKDSLLIADFNYLLQHQQE